MKKSNSTKLGKSLIKGLKEVKEGKTNLLYDGKWHKDGKDFNTFDEYMKYCHKQEKEKMKKLTPEQRKKIKDKEKAQIAKRKAEDKKREEKWAKQRAKRGFSDDWIWGMDFTLLKLIPDMLDQLVKNMQGWQSQLGYKIQNNKLIKLNKQKTKNKYNGKVYMAYPDITFKEHQEVLRYLSRGFRQLYTYLCSDDIDYKKLYKFSKKEWIKFYKDRQAKIDKLHNEIFNLFRDCFYSLWD